MTNQASQSADKTAVRKGIVCCLGAMVLFASHDAVNKVLVSEYAVSQIVMFRYWVFVAAAVFLVTRRGSLIGGFRSRHPVLQCLRCLLVAVEIGTFALGLRYMGLAEMHALFALSPLLTTALAGLLLKEQIGWRRISALAIGFLGALLIIKPGMGTFNSAALIPLSAALMFAFYNIFTRKTGQVDGYQTSFLYMAVVGAVATTPFGVASWTMPDLTGWLLLACISIANICGHGLLMKSLQLAPASTLQPFNYFLLLVATTIGVTVFGERLDPLAITGAAMIVGSGLFAVWREQAKKKTAPPVSR